MHYPTPLRYFFDDREKHLELIRLRWIAMTVLYSAIAIVSVSILGAVFLSGRHHSSEQKQTRILLFGLYFWLLAFVQLIIYALVYYVLIKT